MNGPIAATGDHLVVVVAHPDDETFGCGSLIAQASAAGARVTVVCATRGEQGQRRPDPVTDAWPLAVLREVELCQAAMVLGVDDVELLDHADSGFDGPPPPGALVDVPPERLAGEVAGRLAALAPTVVLTLDGSDGHRDHIRIRDAVTSAVRALAADAQPAPGRSPRLVWAGLARSLMQEWAAVMARSAPDRAHLTLDTAVLGRPDDELRAIDVAAVLPVLERAIACHYSQVSPFESLPTDLRRRFLTTAHVLDVAFDTALDTAFDTAFDTAAGVRSARSAMPDS